MVRTLADAVRDPRGCSVPGPSIGDGADVEDLVEVAEREEVLGVLAVAFEARGVELPAAVATAADRARLSHLQAARALRTVARVLDARGVRWVVVKGPAVASMWPAGQVSRTYEDLDVLIGRCDLPAACEALVEAGFEHRNHNWGGFIDLGVAEIPLDDGSVVLDLHWNLVALADQRRDLCIDTEALLDRARPDGMGIPGVATLAAADAFVHLCCHAGLAGARSLRLLRDVHLAGARVEPDEARAALARAGCARLAAPVLDRAVRWFGPLPSPTGGTSDARRICGHPGWIVLNRFVDGIWALVRGVRRPLHPGALVSSGRRGLRSSAAAFLERLTVALRSRLGMRTLVSEGGALHWETVGHGGSQRGLDDYLRYVAGESHCG